MPARPISRRSKALTLVPLALASGAYTVSLVGSSATATSDQARPLPDRTAIPDKAIEAPANVPVPGRFGLGVPAGSADQVVTGATTSGIPAPALSAYQRAAQIIDAADTRCNIPWELLAAIGRVESDHGRADGNTLTAKGVSVPGIYGPELNGKDNTQAITDTDGGKLDQDPVYDRAVGPMQFIPSTWQVVKVDADGDNVRNPQDIDDAALATAVYLCSGNENLATRQGQESAVYRYNHNRDYVNLVLRIMEAYAAGDYTAVPSGSYAGTLFTPDYSTAITHRKHAAKVRQQHGGSAAAPAAGGTTTGQDTTGPTGDTGGVAGGATGTTSGNAVQAITEGVHQVASAMPSPLGPVVGEVADVLDTAAATLLCRTQLSAVPGLATLLKPAVAGCATKVTGETKADATALIPNTLKGVLHWLGLA
jgi:membrane-bound lytic murein transglycosylase B